MNAKLCAIFCIVFCAKTIECINTLFVSTSAPVDVISRNTKIKSKLEMDKLTKDIYVAKINENKIVIFFKFDSAQKISVIVAQYTNISKYLAYSVTNSEDSLYILENAIEEYPKNNKSMESKAVIIMGHNGKYSIFTTNEDIPYDSDLTISVSDDQPKGNIALYTVKNMYVVNSGEHKLVKVTGLKVHGEIINFTWSELHKHSTSTHLNRYTAFIIDSDKMMYRYNVNTKHFIRIRHYVKKFVQKGRYLLVFTTNGRKLVSIDGGDNFVLIHLIGGDERSFNHANEKSIKSKKHSIYQTRAFSLTKSYVVKNRLIVLMQHREKNKSHNVHYLFISDKNGYIFTAVEKFKKMPHVMSWGMDLWYLSINQYSIILMEINCKSYISFNHGDYWNQIIINDQSVCLFEVYNNLQDMALIAFTDNSITERSSYNATLRNYYTSFNGGKTWNQPINEKIDSVLYITSKLYTTILIYSKSKLYVSISAGRTWYNLDYTNAPLLFDDIKLPQSLKNKEFIDVMFIQKVETNPSQFTIMIYDMLKMTVAEYSVESVLHGECQFVDTQKITKCGNNNEYQFLTPPISDDVKNFCYIPNNKLTYYRNIECVCTRMDVICSVGYERTSDYEPCEKSKIKGFEDSELFTCINNVVTRIKTIGYEMIHTTRDYEIICKGLVAHSADLHYKEISTNAKCISKDDVDIISDYQQKVLDNQREKRKKIGLVVGLTIFFICVFGLILILLYRYTSIYCPKSKIRRTKITDKDIHLKQVLLKDKYEDDDDAEEYFFNDEEMSQSTTNTI
ncbi:hypothetical protein A3Q56_00078 [Intoshia linei]|uniref:VPS10 domain-containing protein n=1 Tax=Intoshia linei TaxID=1819745 RepID=A0A177BCW3_9BILA|nr:hypothetical protein A3Q56_00078 [Intoshia linei]